MWTWTSSQNNQRTSAQSASLTRKHLNKLFSEHFLLDTRYLMQKMLLLSLLSQNNMLASSVQSLDGHQV